MASAARLFQIYADGLGIDLSFQSFAEELARLPGQYAPPRGELLLARRVCDGAVQGCVALRPFDDDGGGSGSGGHTKRDVQALSGIIGGGGGDGGGSSGDGGGGRSGGGRDGSDEPLSSTTRRCEMKRLYVCPEARGTGMGIALARAVVQKAAELGYDEALLDTLPSMSSALRLYDKLGFDETPAYYSSPILDTRFYRKDLRGNRERT